MESTTIIKYVLKGVGICMYILFFPITIPITLCYSDSNTVEEPQSQLQQNPISQDNVSQSCVQQNPISQDNETRYKNNRQSSI